MNLYVPLKINLWEGLVIRNQTHLPPERAAISR